MKRYKIIIEVNEEEQMEIASIIQKSCILMKLLDKYKGRVIVEEVKSPLDKLQEIAASFKKLERSTPPISEKNNSVPSYKRPRFHNK